MQYNYSTLTYSWDTNSLKWNVNENVLHNQGAEKSL